MQIIEANVEHFTEIEALVRKIWEPTYRHIVPHAQIGLMEESMHRVEAYENQLREGHRFFVALLAGRIVGFVTFYEIENGLKIPKLYVDNQVHHKGTGRTLMKKVVEVGVYKRLKFIELNVNRYNKALYFYRRLGFYIYASVDIPWQGYFMTDYVMRLDLK